MNKINDSELKELTSHWMNKYHDVFVSLWSNEEKTKYFGKIVSFGSIIDLNADSINSLISVGEEFLRKVKSK